MEEVVEDLLWGRSDKSESRRWRRASIMGSAPLDLVSCAVGVVDWKSASSAVDILLLKSRSLVG